MAAVSVLAALLALAFPVPAAAHLRAGTVAVDYVARVLAPHTAAYSARIFQSDRGLSLTLERGHSVVLVGYVGEPVFRLDRAGLWINEASPTAVVDGVLPRRTKLAGGVVHWRLRAGRTSVSWHDTRAQGLPAGLRRGRWRVPLIVDGHPALLEGELTRFAAPALVLWLVALVAVLTAAAVPVLRRRELLPVVTVDLAGAAGAAAAVTVLGFALDAYASPGTWIEAVDALVFLAVGFGVLLRGPGHLHLIAAIGIGLVSLAVALLAGAVFLHPIVLAIVPGWCVRVLCVVALGAGAAAAGLGCLSYAGTLTAVLEGDSELDAHPLPVRRP